MSAASNPSRSTGKVRSRLQQETGKTGPFESRQQELYLNMVRSAAVAGEAPQACLKRHGLREATYNVLRIVLGHGEGGVPSQSIAADMVTRVPDITRLVDGLEKRNLIERERCRDDRRVVYVRITAEGRDTVEKLRAELDAIHRSQFPGFSEAQMVRLIRLLEKTRDPVKARTES